MFACSQNIYHTHKARDYKHRRNKRIRMRGRKPTACSFAVLRKVSSVIAITAVVRIGIVFNPIWFTGIDLGSLVHGRGEGANLPPLTMEADDLETNNFICSRSRENVGHMSNFGPLGPSVRSRRAKMGRKRPFLTFQQNRHNYFVSWNSGMRPVPFERYFSGLQKMTVEIFL